MCEPVTISAVAAGVGVVSSLASQKAQADQIGEARAAQARQAQELVKQNNYRDQALTGQDRENYDAAIQQLQNASLNSIRNQGMIEAAFGETGLEGRSIDAVMREVQGQDASVADGVRADYANKRRAIQLESETGLAQTQAAIAGQSPIRSPDALTSTLQVISGGLSGAAQGASLATSYSRLGAGNVPKITPLTGANMGY